MLAMVIYVVGWMGVGGMAVGGMLGLGLCMGGLAINIYRVLGVGSWLGL